MEKNKVTKISLSTFFLILSLIVIIVMGIFMYKFYNEKIEANKKSVALQSQVNSLNETVSELQGKLNSSTETINSDNLSENTNTENTDSEKANSDFEKLMNLFYPPKEYKKDSSTYNYMINEGAFIKNLDQNENVSIGSTSIFLWEDEICLNIEYLKDINTENVSTTIKGIDEEIVAVVLETAEAGASPSAIVLLTRKGNVYYLTDFSGNFEAQKIDELSEIIKIDTFQKFQDGSFHSKISTIAIDKDGNCIDIDKYIY